MLNTHKVPSSILGRNNGKVFHCKGKIYFDFFDKYLETQARIFHTLARVQKKNVLNSFRVKNSVFASFSFSVSIIPSHFSLPFLGNVVQQFHRVSVV